MFDKALETIKKVKLPGGIFGKTTVLLIVLCISVATVCVKESVPWLSLILMVLLMAIIFYSLKRCFDFAVSNPQAVIMNGAEFLVHERIVHGRKGQENLPAIEPTTDHPLPPLIEAEVQAQDPPPSAIENKASNAAKGGG